MKYKSNPCKGALKQEFTSWGQVQLLFYLFTPLWHPSSLPLPPPPSHFLFFPPSSSSSSSCNAGALLSFVWLLILAKRTDQIFLLQCMRLSAGASQIWWLGLTDGRGPRVLKSVTDSGGFDSPRSSHNGSPKTPGEKRGEDEERQRGVKDSAGNKSICRVVRAGGSSSSRQRLFEVYTRPSPPFLFLFSLLSLLPPSPKSFCFHCPWMPRSCFFCPSLFLSLWWYPGSAH